jgi:SAM-dependent methyltransferase
MSIWIQHQHEEPEPLGIIWNCKKAEYIKKNGKTKNKKIFDSDGWSLAIWKATGNEIDKIFKEEWRQVSFMELGTWKWTIPILMIQEYNDKLLTVVWTDIVPDAIELARELVKDIDRDNKCEFIVSDWLKDVPQRILDILDFNVACLPQVKFTLDKQLLPDDHFAHFVDWEKFKDQDFERFWFWLIEKTIKDFRMKNSKANILYNFAWRISKDIIFALYESCWYTPEIVYNEMVVQCETTELWMFVDLEKSEPEALWEFYEDIEGKIKITAEMAENRRKDNMSVYHRMYVVKWVPKVNFWNKVQ